MKGDFIKDVSLAPLASPPYDAFASWFMPTQEGSFGTIWNNGFLTCGGRINNITHEATDICKHVPIGNTVATNHPSLTRAFSRSASTTVNGKLWITGGIKEDTGELLQNYFNGSSPFLSFLTCAM